MSTKKTSKKAEAPTANDMARGLSMNTQQLIQFNRLCSRMDAIREMMDPKKNIDAECGYPDKVSVATMDRLYRRGDIAKRVVSAWSDESWLIPPTIYETEHAKDTKFEKEWKALNTKLAVLPTFQRADELSGIGCFGVILLGWDDGKALNEPLEGIDDLSDITGEGSSAQSHELIYLRTFAQRSVRIAEYEKNQASPRFGLPTKYQINQYVDSAGDSEAGAAPPSDWFDVHWTRIQHLADNRKESNVFGEPRLKVVYDRIYDTRKIYGAAGEGYWKAGVPAYAFSMNPDVKDAKIDVPSVQRQMDMFANGLQKYLALENMSVNPLDSKIQDPNLWVDCMIQAICIAMNIPVPVFKGNVSKDTDMTAWNLRLRSRQDNYVVPYIIRPFFNRMFAAGALTKPAKGLFVKWTDLNGPTEDQKATIAQKRTQALSQYTGSNAEWLVNPYDFFLFFCGFTEEEAEYLASQVDEQYMQEKNDAALVEGQGGAGPDNPGATVTGTKGMGAGGSRDETKRRPKNFARKTQL